MNEILASYFNKNRFYHNQEHVLSMLTWLDEFFPNQTTKELLLAILFHDIVYVPTNSTNERQSAKVFETWARLNNVQCDIDKIVQMILDTKEHVPTIDESRILIDLDLYGLSLPFEEYMNASFKVQQEFVQKISLDEFILGRIDWLTKMLNRSCIFQTKEVAYKECDARRNMFRELSWLKRLKMEK